MKPALLLIDWQRDFLPPLRRVPGAGEAVDRAARLLRTCRAGGVPVFHVRLVVDRKPDTRMPHWKAAGRWTCVRGTSGAEPPEPLREQPGEPVFEKRFFRAFADGLLAAALDEAGIDTIVLSGLFLHACVRAAALDAYELGRRVWVAEDAVASDRPLDAAVTREYLAARGIRLAPVHELEELVRGAAAGRVAATADHPGSHGPGVVVDRHREAAVEAAVARARRGWRTLRASSMDVRARHLRRLADLLAEESERLAEAIAVDVGKPIRMARAEIARCRELVESACRAIDDLPGEDRRLPDGSRCRRVPLGVLAMLTPWNHPLAIPVGKLAPAILHGNAVVWKPAPAARAVAEQFVELVVRAGWPEGWLTLLGGGAATGVALMRHPGVAAVTVTGGPAAGFAAQAACAERRIPLQAELGGNNAAIVWADADLDTAAEAIALGAFGFAGQRCTANRRLIVDATCRDTFMDRLVRATAALPWGDPLDEATLVGPIVSPGERDRIARAVDRARLDGWRPTQPHLADPRGSPGVRNATHAWFPPTIIPCDDPDHEIVREETFGPVLVVQPAVNWEAALALCSRVPEGLVAALFTSSPERQADFLHRAEAGVLKINQATADVGVEAPFGGWKASGVGPPEHGPANREFHTRWQAIYGSDPLQVRPDGGNPAGTS